MIAQILFLSLLSYVIPVYPGESIQDALDSSVAGDTVLVKPGIHYGSGENLAFFTGAHNGIILLGDIQNPSSVVLSGDSISDSIIDFDCSAGGQIDSSTVVAGFTFIDGDASMDAFGGAIHAKHSSPLIKYSRFFQCSADNGAAIYVWKGAPVIRHCVFDSNECISAGGAIYFYSSDASLSHSIFTGNISWDDGGAVFLYHSSPEIFNCIFNDGYTHDDGGGIYCYALSHPEISFCTFFDNFALNTGSAVYFRVNSSPELHHNIVTGNVGPAFYIQDGGEPDFKYNCVWGNPDGNYGNLPDQTGISGNISADPLFTGDFFLSQIEAGQSIDSPCVNSGNNFAEFYGLEFFWTRSDSISDSSFVDMGFHHGSGSGWQSNPYWPQNEFMQISPNPTPGLITVVTPEESNFDTINCFDLYGRMVYSSQIQIEPIVTGFLGNCSPGVYLIVLTGESGFLTGRVTLLTP